MCVMREFGDKVSGDAQDYDRGYPVHSMVGGYGWPVDAIRTDCGTSIVISSVSASHIAKSSRNVCKT